MVLTPNYDPTPLAPKILIDNLAGVNQFTFETSVTNATPTQDFSLRSLSIELGLNDNYGNAVLLIDDPSNALTDTTTRRGSTIQRQWNIQIELGKSSSTKYRVFYGKIMEVEIIRPNTNLQQIRVLCTGWGIRLKDRLTKIKRFQAKDADGITLDATDTTVRVSELAKDLLEDVDHYPDLGQTTEAGITVTGVDTIDVKLADFQQNYQTWSAALSTLSAAGGAIYALDADRDLIFRVPGNTTSGFLFTNNLSGLDAQGWSNTKIGYLFRSPFSWTDSTYESAISHLVGINTSIINLDTEQTAANATRSLHLSWLAIPFTPTTDNIYKIAPSLAKTGTPANSAEFRIIGRDATNTPNEDDLRKKRTIAKEVLQGLGASGAYTEISFEKVQVTPREQLFLLIKKYGNSSNTFVIDYQTGTGTYYTSSDGLTWSSATGDMKLRTYAANPSEVFVENINTKNKFGTREKLIPFRNEIQQEAAREILINLSEVLGKERRIYSDIIVSAPTDRIPLGSTCRLQDAKTGLDVTGEVIGLNINMNADTDGAVGTNQITLKIMELHY